MIGYNYRFLQPFQRARDLIRSDHFGPVVGLRSVFSTARRALPEWKQRRETGGGALFDLASHQVDLGAGLVGAPPRFLSCDLHSRETDDDIAMLQLEFPGGISAQLFAAFGGPEQHRVEIFGERGMVLIDPYGSEFVETRPAALDGIRLLHLLGAARAMASPGYWLRKASGSNWHVSYRQALGCFVHGARAGRAQQPDRAAGCETLAWLEAARESAHEGRRVPVRDALP
jgi:predicted dehydrogenase